MFALPPADGTTSRRRHSRDRLRASSSSPDSPRTRTTFPASIHGSFRKARSQTSLAKETPSRQGPAGVDGTTTPDHRPRLPRPRRRPSRTTLPVKANLCRYNRCAILSFPPPRVVHACPQTPVLRRSTRSHTWNVSLSSTRQSILSLSLSSHLPNPPRASLHSIHRQIQMRASSPIHRSLHARVPTPPRIPFPHHHLCRFRIEINLHPYRHICTPRIRTIRTPLPRPRRCPSHPRRLPVHANHPVPSKHTR